MNARSIELLRMLEYRRPLHSESLAEFCARFIAPLPGVFLDEFGNYHVRVGDSRVLWSSHTDTVHTVGGKQTLHYDQQTSIVSLSRKARTRGSNCLGADCTVGVWIMRNMILAGVPGYYIFHYGEERGGIGSTALARKFSKWLEEQFDFAIAFDRRGKQSIITHQSGWRTASDLFALSLQEEMHKHGLAYQEDDGGTYTDTYEYASIVPECTNLSVGYAHEHRDTETAHVDHANRLLDCMCAIDQSQLIKDRDPNDPRNDSWSQCYIGGSFGTGTRTRDYSWQDRSSLALFDRTDTHAHDPIFGVCITCGEGAWIDRVSFECIDCEIDQEDGVDELRTAADRQHDRSVYLDSTYAEVQAQLADLIARNKFRQ